MGIRERGAILGSANIRLNQGDRLWQSQVRSKQPRDWPQANGDGNCSLEIQMAFWGGGSFHTTPIFIRAIDRAGPARPDAPLKSGVVWNIIVKWRHSNGISRKLWCTESRYKKVVRIFSETHHSSAEWCDQNITPLSCKRVLVNHIYMRSWPKYFLVWAN